MDHHIITIDASPSQLGKLRRGHPVRIRRGRGFNLIVHPNTYKIVTRAFAKNKGAQVVLTPEEIEMNRMMSPEQHQSLRETQPEMAGQGIFGKKFDKLLKKAGIKKLAYEVGDVLKPHAKTAITAGLTAGTAALGAYAPQLLPFATPLATMANTMAHDYLDRPGYYQQKGLKSSTQPIMSLAQEQGKALANQTLNEQLGTNYDYMSRAGLEQAFSDQLQKNLSEEAIAARFGQYPASQEFEGRGFLKRRLTKHHEMRASGGTLSGRNTLIFPFPPALKSQPLSANYQMQHFLPPAYQGYNSGAGLYAGRGLYT